MSTVLLSENFYSTSQFPDHLLDSVATLGGHEAFHVGRASRSHLNFWAAADTTNFVWISVDCGVLRTADTIALDRGHSLAGLIVRIQVSTDDFNTDVTNITPVNRTIPATPGGELDAGDGVSTEEGAWLLRFTETSSRYWRFAILGTGGGNPDILKQITGLWLGKSFDIPFLDKPLADDGAELIADEQQTPYGWRGAATTAHRRNGTLNIRLDSFADYDLARYHVQQRFHDQGRPSWVVFDDQVGERAVLARPVPGTLAFEFRRGWPYRRATMGWVEHGPKFGRIT